MPYPNSPIWRHIYWLATSACLGLCSASIATRRKIWRSPFQPTIPNIWHQLRRRVSHQPAADVELDAPKAWTHWLDATLKSSSKIFKLWLSASNSERMSSLSGSFMQPGNHSVENNAIGISYPQAHASKLNKLTKKCYIFRHRVFFRHTVQNIKKCIA